MESGSSSEQEYVKVDDDVGKDDMFEDAEDELNPETRDSVPTSENVDPTEDVVDRRLGDAVLKAETGDSESRFMDIQEERQLYAREIGGLWHQMKVLKNQQPFSHVNDDMSTSGHYGELVGESHEDSVHAMISECSEFMKLVVEERQQIEGTIQELRAALYSKDQEIEVLNAKVSGLSVFQDIAGSKQSGDTSDKDRLIDEVATRILDSLAPIVDREELQNEISGEKLVQVEEWTGVLIKQRNDTLHQIKRLQHVLAENCFISVDLSLERGCSDIVSSTCNELIEAKRREADLAEKISQVELENRRLVEQLRKEKEVAEETNSELGQLKLELEQEKTRYVSVKEKLSLAVTKGKSLVQQRDSLKQSLAEKTSELERCLAELDDKRRALDGMKQTKEELANSENLIALLQENLSQRNLTLVKLEEIFSDASLPREMHAVDIVEKCRWLTDDRILLKENSFELERLKDLLAGIEIPQSISGSDFVARIVWLRDSFSEAHQLAEKVGDEIIVSKEAARNGFDRLSALFSLALLERDYLQFEVDDLLFEYNEEVKKKNEVSLEKDRIIRLLLEHSNFGMDDNQVEGFPGLSLSDCSVLIKSCLEKLKTQSTHVTSSEKLEYLEKIQSFLFVSDLESKLHEKILEEEMLEKSQQLNSMSNELRSLSKELSSIKEQEESLRKDLERSEEKSALLREKLSMAVKKGKGLVQDREKFKQEIEEKNAEMERLKSQNQLLESSFTEYRELKDKVAIDLAKLEEDLFISRNQRDELESSLMEKEKRLGRMIESLNGINAISDMVFPEPAEKVEWLARQLDDFQKAKEHAELELVRVHEESNNLGRSLAEAHANVKELQDGKHDFEKVREEASVHARSLVEAKATITSLEDALSSFQDDVFQLSEEKRALESGVAHLEEGLRKATEEVSSQARLLIEASNSRKSIEDAFSQAKDEIAWLNNEKDVADASRIVAEEHLADLKEEMSVQTSKLDDAYQTIKSLQDKLSQTENDIAALTEEKEEARVGRATAEEKLVKLNEEILGAHQIIKSLEKALSQLKEAGNSSDRSASDEELQKFKEESNIQLVKLAEAYESIKSLRDASSELEKKVSSLTEQNHDLEVSGANLENTVKKLQVEAGLKATELEDAAAGIKSLEGALVKSKNDILVLMEEKEAYILENASLESRLNACMEELEVAKGNLESKLLELTHDINEFQSIARDESLSLLITQSFKNKVECLKGMNRIIGSLKSPFATTAGLENISPNEEDLIFTHSFAGDNDRMTNSEVEIVDAIGTDPVNIEALFKRTIQGYQSRNRNLIEKYQGMSALLDNDLATLSRKLEVTKEDITTSFEDVKSLKQNVEALETSKFEHEKTISSLEENIRNLISACNDAAKSLQIDFKNNIRSLHLVPKEESQDAPLVVGESAVDVENLSDGINGRKCSETVRDLFSAVRNIEAMIKEFESSSTATNLKIQDLERELQETEAASEKAMKERDSVQLKVSKLETQVKDLDNQCDELTLKLAESQNDCDQLRKREEEISLHNDLLSQQGKLHTPPFPPTLLEKISNINVEIPLTNLLEEIDPRDALHVHKLSYVIDSFTSMQNQVLTLSRDKEELQSTIAAQVLENESLKKEVQMHAEHRKDREILKNELKETSYSLKKVLGLLCNDELEEARDLSGLTRLLAVLEKHIMRMLSDVESSKIKAQELGAKLSGRQKVVDDLTEKVKLLEHLFQGRSTQPEIIQDRNISEASSLPTGSEINEIEDTVIASVPSAAHVRPMRKGSTEHLSLSIDVESDPLVNRPGFDEDKGHVFKALVTSGPIPRQGKLIADRIDGFWVSGSKVLMNRPRARLGFIAYWLLLQMWFLVTLL